MGFGTNDTSGLKTTYFKIEGLKQGSKEVYFSAKQKKDDKYVDLSDIKPTFIEGTLKELKFDEYEYEGKVKKQIRITLEDMTDRCVLTMGFSGLAVNILNTLAGCEEDIGNVKLNVYMSKKGYPSVSVYCNGSEDYKDSKWKWDFQKDLAPKVEVIKNKKGEVVSRDNAELIEFLIKYFESDVFQKKIIDKAVGHAHAATPTAKPDYKTNAKEVAVDDDDSLDLPF